MRRRTNHHGQATTPPCGSGQFACIVLDVKPAYRIVSERLVLRCYELVDAPLLKDAIDANVEHLRDMPWIRFEPQTLEEK